MPLIKGGRFVEDGFTNIPDDGTLPDGPAIVSLARFAKERDALVARGKPLGVRLKSAESPEGLKDDLPKIALVAIEFPVFRDGRGFSWARMLRTRLRLQGRDPRCRTLSLRPACLSWRASASTRSEVRRDFRRAGFRPARSARCHNVYQPSADGRKTIRDLRAEK